MKAESLWQKDGFSVVVSMDTPKGTDTKKLIESAEAVKGRIDGILINEASDAIMRMTPMAACLEILRHNILPVMGINARDRNRLALQGDLLGAWSLGIRHVLFEKGKDPSYGDHPLTKPVYDVSRLEFVEMVAGLNRGVDDSGLELTDATDYIFGAAVDWINDDQINAEFLKMQEMAQKGIKYFVVSPQFDVDRTLALLDRARSMEVPIFVSVMLLKSVGMARYLREVPGVSPVPEDTIQQLAKAPVKARAGVDIAVDFIKRIRGAAQGVVILPVGWAHKVPEILEGIGG